MFYHGYSLPNRFIAAQGPLPSTVDDFWRMIVQEKCCIIVMLCKIKEGGKIKCEQYWPEQNAEVCIGNFRVKNVNEVEYCGYVKRTLLVTYTEDDKQVSREITHFHYSAWPDHNIPVETTSILKMQAAVLNEETYSKEVVPILIHCSAGVGRTGTFIALYNLLKEAEETRRIDPFVCVVRMRKQRMQMIQNYRQYIFIHKLVLEKMTYGCTDYSVDQFKDAWETSTNQSRIDNEFQNLQMIEMFHQYETVMSRDSSEMNNADYAHARVFIVQQAHEVSPPKINASSVQNYCSRGQTIASSDPTRDSIFYFLRMIIDNGINTIVMLSEDDEYIKNGGFIYWPCGLDQVVTVGTYHMTLQSVQKHGGITQRKLKLVDNFSQVNIMQFQCSNWTSEGTPQTAEDIFSVINLMQINHRTDVRCGAVIHCSDGKGRSGLLCSITNLIERLKSEQMCDVFRTVKDLRDNRPGMVVAKEQYEYCYEAIARYLDSFKLYENFTSSAV